MTIKEIKEKYKDYRKGFGVIRNMFAVYDFGGDNGKVVVVVNYCGELLGRDVVQVVRVSDGKELLTEERCRPCDNLDDAIDVAMEMVREEEV